MKWLKHKDIDKSWWNNQLDLCENSLIYAKSWYLDAVSPNWELIILEDDMGFIPVTSSRKFGFIKSWLQPLFCQQLGVFYKTGFNLEEGILESISKRYTRFQVHQNAGLSLNSGEPRINYILDLNKPFEALQKDYSKDARKNLRKPIDFMITNSVFDENKFNTLTSTYMQQYGAKEKFNSKKLTMLKQLLLNAKSNEALSYFEIHSAKKQLLFTAAILRDTKRLYYLFAAPTDKGRTLSITHYFIHYLIEENAGKQLLLDFEGSMIPNVASFYKKWGSKTETYQLLKKKT